MTGQLSFVGEEIDKIPELKILRPTSRLSEGLGTFVDTLKESFVHVFRSSEVLGYALLQFCCVALGYFLWVQILPFMPDRGVADEPNAGYLLWVWSMLIVALVALPLGILSGEMGASYFLRKQGIQSTFTRGIRLSARSYRGLWVFYWIDINVTLSQIVRRLPKTGERTVSAGKLAREVAYFAWKVATLGLLPSLLNGRGLVVAARESILLLKKRLSDVVLLRIGYSVLSWFMGIVGYLFTIYLIIVGWFPPELQKMGHTDLYYFYLYAGFPVCVAMAPVILFLRPVFVIGSCKLYSEFVKVEKIKIDEPMAEHTLLKIGVGMACVMVALATIYVVALRAIN